MLSTALAGCPRRWLDALRGFCSMLSAALARCSPRPVLRSGCGSSSGSGSGSDAGLWFFRGTHPGTESFFLQRWYASNAQAASSVGRRCRILRYHLGKMLNWFTGRQLPIYLPTVNCQLTDRRPPYVEPNRPNLVRGLVSMETLFDVVDPDRRAVR